MMEQKIQLLSFPPSQYINNENNNNNYPELKNLSRLKRDDSSCDHAANKYLCLPLTYSKFELPHTDSVNVVEIGIDISDVLRINDKVNKDQFRHHFMSTICASRSFWSQSYQTLFFFVFLFSLLRLSVCYILKKSIYYKTT